MYISGIQISNFKGYRESAAITFEPGVNVIVGKNNVGKTALLQALSLKFDGDPHRSIHTLPTESASLSPYSSVDLTVTLARDELVDMLLEALARRDQEFGLPLPTKSDPLWRKLGLKRYDDAAANRFCRWFFGHDSYTFSLRRNARGNTDIWYLGADPYRSPRFSRSSTLDGHRGGYYGRFSVDRDKRTFSFRGLMTGNGEGESYYGDFVPLLGRSLAQYLYLFRAERFPSEPCSLRNQRRLDPDARNLAEVLHLLQENHTLFGRFLALVREILPEIHQAGVLQVNEHHYGEVFIWTDKEATDRQDLAFSLQHCGTGVGQVLAILYVLLTAKKPQTIIIDEPQGFLHPGAVRKLIEILRREAQSKHQFIIATHSPTVITAADPTTVTVVRQEGAESILEIVDAKEVRQQQRYLSDIGARLTDVFGYDRVLWVEGQTEEQCFPIILRTLAKLPALGTAILRVQHTGDLNPKHLKNVLSTYERLSHLANGLVPPAVGFIFDKEERTESKLSDLRHLSSRLHFLPRRMYENYLLNPAAIAAVANSIEGFSKRRLTSRRVQTWLERHKLEAKYYSPLKPPTEHPDKWVDTIHGARVLVAIFAELSETRVTYDKPEHSRALTEWIVKNAPEELKEISDLLSRILNNSEKVMP